MHPERRFRWASAGDCDLLAEIMFDAVRHGESRYTEPQRAAWLPSARTGPDWTARVDRQEILVAEQAGRAIGFVSLADGGYIDFAFAKGEPLLWTHASLMAEPAFERLGFRVRKREPVTLGGQSLDRCEMEMRLTSRD